MMKLRAPIYAQVLLWFMVNLLLLAALGYGFMHLQFRLSLDWMLAGPTGQRLEQVADSLSDALGKRPESEWAAVLKRFNEARGITFTLFSSDGRQILGDPVEVPREVRRKLIDKRMPGDRPPPPPPRPEAMTPLHPAAEFETPPKPRFIIRSDAPARYWAGIHLDLVYRDATRALPLTLVMISDSLFAGGLFLDPWPWLALAASGLLISLLVWLPFVRSMTRFIHRLNTAASRIAHGQFTERVPAQRSDELGELATSVNTMAAQLGDYVAQQRRITSDVAHELCSPIARMQMALGIVEQRGTPEQAGYLKKLDGELQHMAKLVEEVLTFAKTETLPEQEAPSEIHLLQLIEPILEREAAGIEVAVNVPAGLTVHALHAALERAIANVVRNAVRYAAQGGAIEITAKPSAEQIHLSIRDHGPGVPAESLAKIFDAFFRLDPARGRSTGGTGLGLAIVKRCLAASGGDATASLPAGGGLEITLQLPR